MTFVEVCAGLCEGHYLCVASLLAALLVVVDVALNCKKDTLIVFATKEWWGMLICQVFFAYIYFRVLQWSGYFAELNHLELFLGIIAYPMLLHSTVLTCTPLGVEYLLKKFEKKFCLGIRDSIDERRAKLLGEWRQIDLQKLDPFIRDYLASHCNDAEIADYIIRLLDDSQQNPETKIYNSRVIYQQVLINVGGLRGIRWIMRSSKR